MRRSGALLLLLNISRKLSLKSSQLSPEFRYTCLASFGDARHISMPSFIKSEAVWQLCARASQRFDWHIPLRGSARRLYVLSVLSPMSAVAYPLSKRRI